MDALEEGGCEEALERGVGEVGDGEDVDEDGDEVVVGLLHGGGEEVEERGEVVEEVGEFCLVSCKRRYGERRRGRGW